MCFCRNFILFLRSFSILLSLLQQSLLLFWRAWMDWIFLKSRVLSFYQFLRPWSRWSMKKGWVSQARRHSGFKEFLRMQSRMGSSEVMRNSTFLWMLLMVALSNDYSEDDGGVSFSVPFDPYSMLSISVLLFLSLLYLSSRSWNVPLIYPSTPGFPSSIGFSFALIFNEILSFTPRGLFFSLFLLFNDGSSVIPPQLLLQLLIRQSILPHKYLR